MSTKKNAPKTPPSKTENHQQQQAGGQTPLKRLAARLSLTAFNDQGRKFEPLVIPIAVANIGEKFKQDFELTRKLFLTQYGGLSKETINDVGVELWLACHRSFYEYRLELDSSWRPTRLDDDEEVDVKTYALIRGIGQTLFSYGYWANVEIDTKDRTFDLAIVYLHLLGLADKATFEGKTADAFDWLYQAVEARMIGARWVDEAHGIKFGKLLGRSEQASLAGKSRWDQSLGAQDKAHVLTLWNAWQSSLSKYRGNAEFSRNAIKDCAVIEDTKTIERWCREWQLRGDQKPLLMREPPNDLTE